MLQFRLSFWVSCRCIFASCVRDPGSRWTDGGEGEWRRDWRRPMQLWCSWHGPEEWRRADGGWANALSKMTILVLRELVLRVTSGCGGCRRNRFISFLNNSLLLLLFLYSWFIYLFIYLDFYCSSDTVEHPGDSLCSYHQSIPPVPRPSWTVVSKILDGLANLGWLLPD